MRFFGFGFLLLAGLELLSILMMARLAGMVLTLLLMAVGFFAGLNLLRGHAGLSRLLAAGAVLRGSSPPSAYQMLWPIRIPMAGLLLMMPGFLSDLLALLLLIPLRGKTPVNGGGSFSAGGFQYRSHSRRTDDDVIEGDFVVRSSSGSRRSSPSAESIEHKKD